MSFVCFYTKVPKGSGLVSRVSELLHSAALPVSSVKRDKARPERLIVKAGRQNEINSVLQKGGFKIS